MTSRSIIDLPVAAIETVEGVGREEFDAEIRPAGKPVVLRNFVEDWPAVDAGKASSEFLADYLKTLDVGASTPTFIAPPEADGRYFYTEDMRQFTFESREIPLQATIDKLLEQQQSE